MESNIFKILGIDSKENYHSKFLVEILKSDKDAMKSFIEKLQEVVGKNKIIHSEIDKYKIKNEKKLNENGRVDIFFSDHPTGNTRIIIENKIYAGDQPHQLYRYHNNYNVKDNYNCVLFYLTLDRKDATNFSKMSGSGSTSKCLVKNKDYFLLSFDKEILPWLKMIVKDNQTPQTRLESYIADYIQILEELTTRRAKLSKMIEKNYPENEESSKLNPDFISKSEFNDFLELRFWEYLENKMFIIKGLDGISNRRLFNYKKIQKKTDQRRYGVIFNILDSEEQISVLVDKKGELSISFGRISDNNKWLPTHDKDTLKFNVMKINDFKNEVNMKIVADEIANKIANLIIM